MGIVNKAFLVCQDLKLGGTEEVVLAAEVAKGG